MLDVNQLAMANAGVEALLTTLDPDLDPTLQEACVDSICKVAAAPENRQRLLQQVYLCLHQGLLSLTLCARTAPSGGHLSRLCHVLRMAAKSIWCVGALCTK